MPHPAYEGVACSRRDDLESAALLLIHILTPGGLPWTRNGVPRDELAHDRLKREKRAALPEDLARGLPEEFEELLRYCRCLSFTQQPDYAHWRERFRDLAKDLGYKDIDRFMWPPPPAPLVNALFWHFDETSGDLTPMSSRLQVDCQSPDLTLVNWHERVHTRN